MNNTNHSLKAAAGIFVVALALGAAPAKADLFCFELYFKSDYQNCPSNQNGMLWPVTCNASNRTPRNLVVELFDMDNSGGDDFIGEYTLAFTDDESQQVCLEFSWDPVARGETSPDPFIRTDFKVKNPSSSATRFSQACDIDDSPGSSCSDLVSESWRSFAVTNCSGSCTSGTTLVFNTDPTGTFNQTAMVMHGAGRYEQIFGLSSLRESDIFYHMGGVRSGCATVCQFQQNWVNYPFGSSTRRWDVPTHEAGHSHQKQLFQQQNLTGTACPSPHIQTDTTTGACATREGYATYIHAVSWWSAGNSASRPTMVGVSIEGDSIFGGSDPTKSTCLANSDVEIEVARTFWDLDDINNEGQADSPGVGDDSENQSQTSIQQGWRNVPNGTGNHQNDEAGNNANNLKDYLSVNFTTTDIAGSMLHNATDCQGDP